MIDELKYNNNKILREIVIHAFDMRTDITMLSEGTWSN